MAAPLGMALGAAPAASRPSGARIGAPPARCPPGGGVGGLAPGRAFPHAQTLSARPHVALRAVPGAAAPGRTRARAAGVVQARETRLAELVTRAPANFDRYINNPRKRFRKNTWKVIATAAGFYTGNMITLAFGTLGVNDVIAGGICVWGVETISEKFWGARNPSFYLLLLNFAKCGFTCALIADAFKLGS